MGQLKPSEEGYIIEFNSNDDPTAKCYKCKNWFRPEHLQCTIVAPDMENSRAPCKIKWMHFKCKTGQQHRSFDRVRAVSAVKGFNTLAPEHQETLRTLYPEAPFYLANFNVGQQPIKADKSDDSGDSAGEEHNSAEWHHENQAVWARFLVAAVRDPKLVECATAQDFDRDDMSIELRRASRPFNVGLEEQASRIACLIKYCRNMPDDDIRAIARTLAAQLRRAGRKTTREHNTLVRMASTGDGHVITTFLVHGHYRGRFTKGDPMHFRAGQAEPPQDTDEVVHVYNAAWEQVGELTQSASALLAPLVREAGKFKFTNYVRMGNLNSSTGIVHRVVQMPINIAVETIQTPDDPDEDSTMRRSQTDASTSSESQVQVLGMFPPANYAGIRLVTVICPSIPQLGGSFTLRWWPGDEDDCFFDFTGTDARPTNPPWELMLQYPDGTELFSLEEEWERATEESLGAVERRYSVPVGSCITACTRAERATVAVLHAPPM